MVKMQYPAPEWSEIPPVDTRLRSLILPMPRMSNPGYLRTPSATPDELADPHYSNSQLVEVNYPDRFSGRDEGLTRTNGPLAAEHTITTSAAAPGTNAATRLFAPYQPPMHLQSRSTQLQPDRSVDKQSRPSRSGKMDKRDPYEEGKQDQISGPR